MAYDFRTQRLHVQPDLAPGARIEADGPQAHYLIHVLRLREGDPVLLFNGRDGEWRARIGEAGKRRCVLEVLERARAQTSPPDLHYLFAPLKHARLDYMVQKAAEMGAAALRPVLTRHTQVARLNLERMRANVVEAAEQCGILWLAQVHEPAALAALLDGWDEARRLIFCDEDAKGDPLAVLEALPRGPLAVLIGPEGGFAAEERARLAALPYVTAISLGPRILRADTAGVAALTLVQAALGDWRAGA